MALIQIYIPDELFKYFLALSKEEKIKIRKSAQNAMIVQLKPDYFLKKTEI
jgi:hypothetical protein